MVKVPGFTALFLCATVATTHAQTLPAEGTPPPGTASGSAGQPAPFMDPTVSGSAAVAPTPTAPTTPPDFSPAPPSYPALGAPGLPMYPVLPPLDPRVHHRFRSGRIVYNVGTAVGLVGSGLTLASIFLTGIYGLGLDQSADHVTGRIGTDLAYAGSGATATGFILATTGLGIQHSALALVGQDPGRAMYGTGTAVGILGLCAASTSYFFAITRYGGDDSSVVSFATAVAAGTLLSVSSLLYWSDAARMRNIYRRLTTF